MFSERLIFPYSGSSYDSELPGLSMIVSGDGTRLATRYWKASDEAYLVLYFHGNGEDLGYLDSIANKLNQRRMSVLAMDYRGYGLSEGTATEQNAYADARVLYEQALEMGSCAEQLVVWGRSVGSGPAVDLALKIDAHALVLDSPFVTAFRVMTGKAIFPIDRFDNVSKISQIDEPLFVMHGELDQIIENWHGQELYRAHTGMKEFHILERAGHNNLWMYDIETVLRSLDVFLKAATLSALQNCIGSAKILEHETSQL